MSIKLDGSWLNQQKVGQLLILLGAELKRSLGLAFWYSAQEILEARRQSAQGNPF